MNYLRNVSSPPYTNTPHVFLLCQFEERYCWKSFLGQKIRKILQRQEVCKVYNFFYTMHSFQHFDPQISTESIQV